MAGTDSSSKTTKRIVKFSHTWTIENFSFFLHEDLIESPAFGSESHPGTRWCLRLHPKGRTDYAKDYISLYLVLLSSQKSEVYVKAGFSLQGADGQRSPTDTFGEGTKLTPRHSWGWDKFIPRDTECKKYLSDDKLTIRCEVSHAMETENIVNQDPRSQAQCDSAKVSREIYQSRMHSDVVLSLDGKDSRAHKLVLTARSPFLSGNCLAHRSR